jgi:hypothetical protein
VGGGGWNPPSPPPRDAGCGGRRPWGEGFDLIKVASKFGDLVRGEVEEGCDAVGSATGLEQDAAPEDVVVAAGHWVFEGFVDAGLCGQVQDGAYIVVLQDAIHRGHVSDLHTSTALELRMAYRNSIEVLTSPFTNTKFSRSRAPLMFSNDAHSSSRSRATIRSCVYRAVRNSTTALPKKPHPPVTSKVRFHRLPELDELVRIAAVDA